MLWRQKKENVRVSFRSFFIFRQIEKNVTNASCLSQTNTKMSFALKSHFFKKSINHFWPISSPSLSLLFISISLLISYFLSQKVSFILSLFLSVSHSVCLFLAVPFKISLSLTLCLSPSLSPFPFLSLLPFLFFSFLLYSSLKKTLSFCLSFFPSLTV